MSDLPSTYSVKSTASFSRWLFWGGKLKIFNGEPYEGKIIYFEGKMESGIGLGGGTTNGKLHLAVPIENLDGVTAEFSVAQIPGFVTITFPQILSHFKGSSIGITLGASAVKGEGLFQVAQAS